MKNHVAASNREIAIDAQRSPPDLSNGFVDPRHLLKGQRPTKGFGAMARAKGFYKEKDSWGWNMLSKQRAVDSANLPISIKESQSLNDSEGKHSRASGG